MKIIQRISSYLYTLKKNKMNLNFHHRHYAKCTKCQKIHTKTHRGINTKLSTERAAIELLNSLNNEDDIKKDIDADTEGNTDRELDEYRYLYKVRPSTMYKYEIDKKILKPSMIHVQDTSYRHQSIRPNNDTKCHASQDTDKPSPLQKLKELQKQRASSDNFYSREIQKIIAKYFMTTYNTNENRDGRNMEADRRTKTFATEELEQCGVITTIIRLDCGCVQKTRRPIYTLSNSDTRKTYYYHCTDGEIDGEVDTIITTSPCSSPTRSQEDPKAFNYMQRESHTNIITDTPMHHPASNLDGTNFMHSTLKPGNLKSLRETSYRRCTA